MSVAAKYTPNTITYRFPSAIGRDIILRFFLYRSLISEGTIGVRLENALGAHFIDTTDAYIRPHNVKLIAEILAMIPFCKVSKDKYVRLFLVQQSTHLSVMEASLPPKSSSI